MAIQINQKSSIINTQRQFETSAESILKEKSYRVVRAAQVTVALKGRQATAIV